MARGSVGLGAAKARGIERHLLRWPEASPPHLQAVRDAPYSQVAAFLKTYEHTQADLKPVSAFSWSDLVLWASPAICHRYPIGISSAYVLLGQTSWSLGLVVRDKPSCPSGLGGLALFWVSGQGSGGRGQPFWPIGFGFRNSEFFRHSSFVIRH